MFMQIYIEFSKFYAHRKKKLFFKGKKENYV